MFKILTKRLNIHELRLLCELWSKMQNYLHMNSTTRCNSCDDCEYKRLCSAMAKTQKFLDKELADRETEQ